MKKIFLINFLIFSLICGAILVSCDKDYAEIDANLDLDNDHFGMLHEGGASVVAFNQGTGPVQSNNQTLNLLGIYHNPVFGTTKANFATQLELSANAMAATFGENVVLDSVKLYIPYFSTLVKTDADNGTSIYAVDSIYGKNNMRLNVYESGYFINDFEAPNFEEAKKFYNDQNDLFNNYRKGALEDGTSVFNGPRLNNSANAKENDAFSFSGDEIIQTTEDTDNDTDTLRDSTFLAPGMYLNLNKQFFYKKIIEASTAQITNNVTFKDYFRGLYFNVEETNPGKNSMAALNFAKGTITLYYKEDSTVADADPIKKTFVLSLTGNTVSLTENTNLNGAYASAIAPGTPNSLTGDAKLYLKGGEGSIALLRLFDDGLLEEMRSKKWLINEANLSFYVDQAAMNNAPEPLRIYLYDAKNHIPLTDYSIDVTTSFNTKYNKYIHGGILQKEDSIDNARGFKYTVRLTNHLRNLVKYADSTNVMLGLAITENIGNVSNIKLKAPQPFNQDRIPLMSAVSPFGTVLYGNTPEVPDDKKLKLDIYYTLPNPESDN